MSLNFLPPFYLLSAKLLLLPLKKKEALCLKMDWCYATMTVVCLCVKLSLIFCLLRSVPKPFLLSHCSRNPRRQGQAPVDFHEIPFVKDWLRIQWVAGDLIKCIRKHNTEQESHLRNHTEYVCMYTHTHTHTVTQTCTLGWCCSYEQRWLTCCPLLSPSPPLFSLPLPVPGLPSLSPYCCQTSRLLFSSSPSGGAIPWVLLTVN